MKLKIMKLNVTQSPDSPHCVRVKGTSSGAGDTGERVSPGLPSAGEQRYEPAQNIATTTQSS